MPRTYKKKEASIINGPKEERYLGCSHCTTVVVLNLAPQDVRPTHRCSPRFKAASFDIDVPSAKAPKVRWWEERPKHPRPPAAEDRRPEIVL